MISTGPPLEGDVNKGPVLNIATSVAVGVTAIVVALRLSVRIWVTKNVWWDDWTIIFANVRQTLSNPAESKSHLGVGGQHHRRRLGLCGSTLRVWETSLLSYPMANHRVQKVHFWRMDPNLCDLDMDQNLNLSIPYAYPSHQSSYPTTPGRNRLFGVIQCRSDHSLDRSVPAGRGGLG